MKSLYAFQIGITSSVVFGACRDVTDKRYAAAVLVLAVICWVLADRLERQAQTKEPA
jgi:hypothetical protein